MIDIPLDDQTLVEMFLAATSDRSVQEAGELAGVSHATVARWRQGDFVRIYPRTARRIRDFLRRQDGAVRVTEDQGFEAGAIYVLNQMEETTQRVREMLKRAKKKRR